MNSEEGILFCEYTGLGNEYEYVIPTSEFSAATQPASQRSPRKIIPPNSPQLPLNRTIRTIQLRFRELGLPEISKRRLKMLRKLGDGVFGTVSQKYGIISST